MHAASAGRRNQMGMARVKVSICLSVYLSVLSTAVLRLSHALGKRRIVRQPWPMSSEGAATALTMAAEGGLGLAPFRAAISMGVAKSARQSAAGGGFGQDDDVGVRLPEDARGQS
jgi:hypothetical protein